MHTDHCEVQYVIRRSTAGGCRFAHKLQTRSAAFAAPTENGWRYASTCRETERRGGTDYHLSIQHLRAKDKSPA